MGVRSIRTIGKKEKEKPKSKMYTDAELSDNISAVTAETVNVVASREKQVVLYPRASSLYDSCMRMHVLCSKLKRTRIQWISVQLGVTFEIGNAVHHSLQNNPAILGNSRIGFWKCLACQALSEFGRFPVIECLCGADLTAYQYDEFSLKMDDPVCVTGHPDMFLDKGNGNIRVIEFKTMKKSEYVGLAYPLIKHIWQIMLYMRLCNRCVNPTPLKIDETMGYIMYVCKEHTRNDVLPYKVFPVRFDRDTFKLVLDKLLTYRKGIKPFPMAMPEVHEECQSSSGLNFSCWRYKDCPVKTECAHLLKPEGFKTYVNI